MKYTQLPMRQDNMVLSTTNIISKDKPQCKNVHLKTTKAVKTCSVQTAFFNACNFWLGETRRQQVCWAAPRSPGAALSSAAPFKTLQQCFGSTSARVLTSSNSTKVQKEQPRVGTQLQTDGRKSRQRRRGKKPECIHRHEAWKHRTGRAKNYSKTFSIYSKLISCEPKHCRKTQIGPAAVFLHSGWCGDFVHRHRIRKVWFYFLTGLLNKSK